LKYINKAEKLKWLQSTFAWIDALNNENLKKDYILTNVRDVYWPIMSEYVFWYMLMLEKNILWNLEHQKNRVWSETQYPSLVWKKIWILWTWSIWIKIAEIAKVFWMEVYWYSTSDKPKKYIDEMFTHQTLTEFLSDLDYMVSVLPNTPVTQWIINKNMFNQMKPDSIFINVWRWANIDEDDLIDAIKTKKIWWAVLDVFQEEPLPKESKFWNLDNVYITPHISGNMSNINSLWEIFTENYKHYINGEDLIYTIDFNKGY
jgi:phosphoglycerate dehydrogenase-like enzyme